MIKNIGVCIQILLEKKIMNIKGKFAYVTRAKHGGILFLYACNDLRSLNRYSFESFAN